MMLFSFTFRGETLVVEEFGTFKTGQPALVVRDATGAPYARLSVALEGVEGENGWPEGLVLIKDWSENAEMVAAMKAAPGFSLVFHDTGERIQHGYVQIPLWHYNPKGIAGGASC